MQSGRKGRLNPAVGFARAEFARVINDVLGGPFLQSSGRRSTRQAVVSEAEKPLFLVACSGGPDSLALAAVAAHFARRQDARVGAVIVDHQLQEGSAEVAAKAADQCRKLGLDPVMVKTVTVDEAKKGPEMAARLARYGAFADAVAETRAHGVLLAHTLDDQAETVLLGLARGSGTKSLAGMPTVRNHEGFSLIRPLLSVRRSQIAEICAAEELTPWYDPTNADQTLMRARVRHTILPFLEQELGGDVTVSLARTASIVGPDSNYLDACAQEIFDSGELTVDSADFSLPPEAVGTVLALDRKAVAQLPDALRRRVLVLAVKQVGAYPPVFERLAALDMFAAEHSVAGPLQLSGHVSAWRLRPPGVYKKTGVLVLASTR